MVRSSKMMRQLVRIERAKGRSSMGSSKEGSYAEPCSSGHLIPPLLLFLGNATVNDHLPKVSLLSL